MQAESMIVATLPADCEEEFQGMGRAEMRLACPLRVGSFLELKTAKGPRKVEVAHVQSMHSYYGDLMYYNTLVVLVNEQEKKHDDDRTDD